MIAPSPFSQSHGLRRIAARFIHALIVAGALCVPLALHSQVAPTVTAKVQPEEIRAGGTAVYSLTIENGKPDDAPQLELPQDFDPVTAPPTYSSQTNIFNGKMTQNTIFEWRISCSKNGTYTIPPQEVQIGGKTYRSNQIRLIVKNNPSTPSSPYDPIITMEIEKREIYLGEAVPLTVNLYLPRGVMPRRLGLVEIPKENFAIQRFPQHPEESIVKMGGDSYTALGFHSTLSALKAGKFKLGPATSEIIIDLPLERGGMHPFFTATEPRKVKPQSNDIELTVLPLPTEDKPANFSGVVGDFDMSATADLKDLTVGDPISVEISITGSGNFDTLSPPGLSGPQIWKTYPARRTNIPRADSIPEGGTHSATFNQVIIPRQMTEFVPPFEFNYFSPTKKKYLIARSQPIPLHMQPGSNSAPTVKATTPGGTVETTPAEPDKVLPPQPKITDILTVLPNQIAWTTPRPVLLHDRRFLLWNVGAAGVFGLLLLGKFAAVLWRSHVRATATPLHALHRELRRARVPRGQFYQMAANYIQMSHDPSEPLPEPLREVLARNEQINYSPTREQAGDPIPRDERSKVLALLQT